MICPKPDKFKQKQKQTCFVIKIVIKFVNKLKTNNMTITGFLTKEVAFEQGGLLVANGQAQSFRVLQYDPKNSFFGKLKMYKLILKF